MLKLGIIGTSSISHHFLEAAHTSGYFQLGAVYSRKIETAEKFVEQYQGVKLFDQLNFSERFRLIKRPHSPFAQRLRYFLLQ